jgi:GR25 family glycosyltransferase involved in LPS biosynthesis
MSNIFFFVINLKRNPDRYLSVSKMLDEIKCPYSRIEAVDGSNIQFNENCLHILKCRPSLLNSVFKCINFEQEWIYDGSIASSFPGLNLLGHEGTKGLMMSNIIAFIESKKLNYDWYCILEDDGEINVNIYNEICKFIQNPQNNNLEMIFLDVRNAGGSAANLFNKNIIDQFINDLHPLSDFSITMEEKYGLAPLWDWKLWCYVLNYNIKYAFLPCIHSGRFPSTIN